MKLDMSVYEVSLRQTERDLGTLESERIRLRGEIARLQRELRGLAIKRIEWVRASGSLKALLQMPLTEEETELCGSPAEKERLAQIPEDAFKDMAIPEAAKNFLVMFGRGATQREIVEGLRKGGINPALKHLDNSLRAALQRRPEIFVFIKEEGSFGQWELAEWNGEIEIPLPETVRPEPRRLSVVGGSDLAAQQA